MRMAHIFIMVAASVGTGAAAQSTPPDPAKDIVVITGDVGQSSTGRIAVNAASGALNQQVNAALVALGDTAAGVGTVSQIGVKNGDAQRSAFAAIEGDAFAGASGMTSVNVAAGSGNQEINLAVMAIGIEGSGLSEAMLGQTRASTEPNRGTGKAEPADHAVELSPGAFQGSSGLAQVNLIGGADNSSANSFALSVTAPANPQ